MSEWKVPVQSLIDHIKTAVDVDPWAKKMAEELLTDPQRRCVDELCNDAIDLLKEQEPVKPIRINTNFEQSWKCGECGGLVNTHFKYCPYCGREVKWE